MIMAADTLAGYIQSLLDGVKFARTTYALDRNARAAAMKRILAERLDNSQEHTFQIA
jgi:hypothetical protein